MFPVVAVPLKVPPIVDAAKFKPAAFTMVTAPVPSGARVKAPVTASWFKVIALCACIGGRGKSPSHGCNSVIRDCSPTPQS